MRIAVSGTHGMGKSTLIEDFIKFHPDYSYEIEPYDQLQDEKPMELSLVPTVESLLEGLDYSTKRLNQWAKRDNIIFDRCPVDFIVYAMCILDMDEVNINDSEVSERFPHVKKALNNLDLIVFLPIIKEYAIKYTEANPFYRKVADSFFKKVYRDDVCDIFPRYGHPRIIELWGDRLTRVKKLESYL